MPIRQAQLDAYLLPAFLKGEPIHGPAPPVEQLVDRVRGAGLLQVLYQRRVRVDALADLASGAVVQRRRQQTARHRRVQIVHVDNPVRPMLRDRDARQQRVVDQLLVVQVLPAQRSPAVGGGAVGDDPLHGAHGQLGPGLVARHAHLVGAIVLTLEAGQLQIRPARPIGVLQHHIAFGPDHRHVAKAPGELGPRGEIARGDTDNGARRRDDDEHAERGDADEQPPPDEPAPVEDAGDWQPFEARHRVLDGLLDHGLGKAVVLRLFRVGQLDRGHEAIAQLAREAPFEDQCQRAVLEFANPAQGDLGDDQGGQHECHDAKDDDAHQQRVA